jgi:hypothetical protein
MTARAEVERVRGKRGAVALCVPADESTSSCADRPGALLVPLVPLCLLAFGTPPQSGALLYCRNLSRGWILSFCSFSPQVTQQNVLTADAESLTRSVGYKKTKKEKKESAAVPSECSLQPPIPLLKTDVLPAHAGLNKLQLRTERRKRDWQLGAVNIHCCSAC